MCFVLLAPDLHPCQITIYLAVLISWNIVCLSSLLYILHSTVMLISCSSERPICVSGVAGAVLQTPLSFIDSFFHSAFSSESSKGLQSQTIRARELKFLKNVYPPPFVTCHASCVTCHMSRIMCHMSRVTCHMSFFFCGEAYRWRVCYQRGLPRLVIVCCSF